MFKNIILLSGLLILPLLVIHGYDLRYPREILAIGLAIILTVYHLSAYKLEFPDNRWIFYFILWAFFATLFIPKIQGLTLSGGASLDGLWNFKPLFYLTIYALMFFVISDLVITGQNIRQICYVICVSSTIMSIIVIGQFFGIENFLKNPSAHDLTSVTQYRLGGLLGHPTLVSAYLVICLPLILYIKQWIPAVLATMAILATRSDFAIGTLIFSSIFFWCYGKSFRVVLSSIICFLSISLIFILKIPVQDSGRFAIWGMILKDMTTPFLIPDGLTYFFTGFGIGSFSYLFPSIHSNLWLQAHNEYLQVFYS